MPLNSVQCYIRDTINGLAMPGGVPSLVAFITPPDPEEDAAVPHAYVWPGEGTESRNPVRGATIPRNTGPGTPAGFKAIEHMIDIYVVWFGQDDDPDSDTSFPGMIDAIMYALRTSGDPAVVTDPYTGFSSQLIDVGEGMGYKTVVNALADQAYNRYDGLITCTILELIQA